MPRAIWSGSITFGLVTIPVKLYTAVSHKNVRFNMLDGRDGSRIKQIRTNADTGEEVPWEHIVKGYPLADGRYVTVTEEELAALDPAATRTIDLLEFVDGSDIDPIFYENPYYLDPDPMAKKAYVLLSQAMERSGKVGIARFVMRTKKYLAALRPKDGRLVMSTMVYADEINALDDSVPLDDSDIELSDAELTMADQLIATLEGEFEPTKYDDEYRMQVLDLIDRKASGETDVVVAPEAPAAEKVVDLMAALEASVAAAKEARGRHPSASEGTKTAKSRKTKKKAAPKKAAARKSA